MRRDLKAKVDVLVAVDEVTPEGTTPRAETTTQKKAGIMSEDFLASQVEDLKTRLISQREEHSVSVCFEHRS